MAAHNAPNACCVVFDTDKVRIDISKMCNYSSDALVSTALGTNTIFSFNFCDFVLYSTYFSSCTKYGPVIIRMVRPMALAEQSNQNLHFPFKHATAV